MSAKGMQLGHSKGVRACWRVVKVAYKHSEVALIE